MRKLTAILTVLLLGLITQSPKAEATSYNVQTSQETLCLASNIYFEARGEPFEGKLAVARVTMNRVGMPKYKNTICEVVYQKNQFSWTNKKHKILDKAAWKEALYVAKLAVGDTSLMGDFKATHYHNLDARPDWNLTKVARIKHHIFYM